MKRKGKNGLCCLKPPRFRRRRIPSPIHPFILYTHLPRMALGVIDSNGKAPAPSRTQAFVSQRDAPFLARDDNAFPTQCADANCFNRA